MAAKTWTTEPNRAFYETFWAQTPDYARYNPGACHRRRLILDVIAPLRAASLLDAGCGDGTLLGFMRQARPDIAEWTGTDLSPATVERNRSRFPGIGFEVLDLQAAALERTFDLVLCSEVIEHVGDQAAAMRHLARMLAPQGHLVVTCPTGRMYATERHFGHVHHPTPQELAGLARASGLRVVSLQNWGWPLYRLFKWATNVDAEWTLKHFADGPYSTGAKLVSNALYWANHANKADDARGCQLVGLFQRLP
jgi:2-polyprenyl-3-methyl-5-hydroxy-6-metoxy-1,4-benzoquinol methylase